MLETNLITSRLIAHRGLWSETNPANSESALKLAIDLGFGIETDIRDHRGQVVISHDPPLDANDLMIASNLIKNFESSQSSGLLALNIKADGLDKWVENQTFQLSKLNYFCFDMSWPQLLTFVDRDVPVAIRVSEWEKLDYQLFMRLGIPIRVWLDSFHSDWWLESPQIEELTKRGQVIIVSPEIHGRSPQAVWEWFAEKLRMKLDVYLCTDHCIEVVERFT